MGRDGRASAYTWLLENQAMKLTSQQLTWIDMEQHLQACKQLSMQMMWLTVMPLKTWAFAFYLRCLIIQSNDVELVCGSKAPV